MSAMLRLSKRASDLVYKTHMPWQDAERLALSEAGISDEEIDELRGECTSSTILVDDEIIAYTASVLVHGYDLINSKRPVSTTASLEADLSEIANVLDATRTQLSITMQNRDKLQERLEEACRLYENTLKREYELSTRLAEIESKGTHNLRTPVEIEE